MLRLPIVPQKPEIHDRDEIESIPFDLPLRYMSDFSVLGLWVSDCEAAVRVLKERFFVAVSPDHAEIMVDGAPGVLDAVETLRSAGIESGVSDIVDGLYQG